MKVIVALEGLSFYSFHGYYEEERRTGNRFVVDIRLETEQDEKLDLDNIDNTINYEEAYSIIKKRMEVPSQLLEYVAKCILDDFYQRWPFIKSAEVSISKLSAPIGGPCKSARVTLRK